MSLDPRLQKFLRFGLIGCGALTVMTAVVNIIGAFELIDPADAESLGISRGEIVVTYSAILIVGVSLIVIGWRWRK